MFFWFKAKIEQACFFFYFIFIKQDEKAAYKLIAAALLRFHRHTIYSVKNDCEPNN